MLCLRTEKPGNRNVSLKKKKKEKKCRGEVGRVHGFHSKCTAVPNPLVQIRHPQLREVVAARNRQREDSGTLFFPRKPDTKAGGRRLLPIINGATMPPCTVEGS